MNEAEEMPEAVKLAFDALLDKLEFDPPSEEERQEFKHLMETHGSEAMVRAIADTLREQEEKK